MSLVTQYQEYARQLLARTPEHERAALILPYELHEDGKIIYPDPPVPSMIQPVFFERDTVSHFSRILELMDEQLLQAVDLIKTSTEVRALLQISETELELLRLRPDAEAQLPFWRSDTNLTPEGMMCIEANTDAARGRGFSDTMQMAFTNTPLMQGFLDQHPEIFPDQEDHILPELYGDAIEQFERFSGKKVNDMRVAMLQWEDYEFPPEMDMYKRHWNDRNIEADTVEPHDIELVDGKVMANGKEYTFLQRWTDVDQVVSKGCTGLLDAYKAGAVTMYPTLSSGILGKKALFVLFSDPQYQSMFDPEKWELVQSIVPWTRIVEDVDTPVKDGSTQPLLKHLKEKKDEYVIKASVGSEGKQVLVGPEATQGEWEQLIDTVAPNKNWIVQEFVQWNRETFLGWDGNAVTEIEKSYDFLGYCMNGSFSGSAARAAGGNYLNFFAGATIVNRYFY